MRHSREEVIQRTIQEFEQLDRLVSGLVEEDWNRPLTRPSGKDLWTVKDALAHITFWKADATRSARRQRRAPEERRLALNDLNRLVYELWCDRSPGEVLAWHRQVQEDALQALREASDEWFGGKERGEPWPADLVGHSAEHRIRDTERALTTTTDR